MRDWVPLMFQMKLWRRWRRVFDLIITNSNAVKLRLLAEGIGPAEVVPNGVTHRLPRPPFSDKPTIAFAGRLVREKGADVLLRAFAKVVQQIPEARLILCGQGPERAHIEKLTAELGLAQSVSITGFRPHEEIERIFRESWVVAIPSIWEEPFGQVTLEAMSNSVAVVASRLGGLEEIVRNGQTGFLVQRGDPNAFAAALLKILGDRELAERMGRAGRELALAEFSETKMVDRFEQFYRSLCSQEPVV
jgi:glycosyltransferase involved in cell wall biosynthesis